MRTCKVQFLKIDDTMPVHLYPWIDQSEDDSGEEPYIMCVGVQAPTDRDGTVCVVAECVGKVPCDIDTAMLAAQAANACKQVDWREGGTAWFQVEWS
jgi:hypothetical protein